MEQIHIQYSQSPLGELILGTFQSQLCLCDWLSSPKRSAVDKRIRRGLQTDYREEVDPVLQETRKQLEQYFDGQRKVFTIPLLTVGTSFQKSVWENLLNIPFGTTTSYRELSAKIGNPKAVRAVAGANGLNAISIFIPCHRVIGSDGTLVGYGGGLDVKAGLLQLESSQV